ncbi:MAG: efflux RND transporter periplasmic adaptor subunit [Desulfotignum sp.]|nr:efflux RND transporter periplasmic adaptor subunit [Desulfotignum sp.]
MKPTSRFWPAAKRIFLRLVWHSIPFIALAVVVMFVIFPLGRKIAAEKAVLAEQQSRQVQETDQATRVITLEMVPEDLKEVISLPGMAKPWKSLEMVAEVAGRVMEKSMDDGTLVSRGDVLAVIDQRDYRNAYDSARASYETALLNQQRFKALSKQQFITQSQLDEVSAQVKTTRAAMEIARLNLERCTIQSPMAGVVDRVHIEEGSFLSVGDPVARILQIDTLKVEVGIPESDVSTVRKLDRFDMTVDALDGRAFTGEYHYLQKTTDSLARLYNLEIRLENPKHEILPDMFVRVAIVKNRDEQGLGVPIYSLIDRGGQTGVFVEDQGQARFVPVDTGFQDGWKIQVTAGLSPGDHVVVVGHRIIDDGEPVQVDRTVRSIVELGQ